MNFSDGVHCWCTVFGKLHWITHAKFEVLYCWYQCRWLRMDCFCWIEHFVCFLLLYWNCIKLSAFAQSHEGWIWSLNWSLSWFFEHVRIAHWVIFERSEFFSYRPWLKYWFHSGFTIWYQFPMIIFCLTDTAHFRRDL